MSHYHMLPCRNQTCGITLYAMSAPRKTLCFALHMCHDVCLLPVELDAIAFQVMHQHAVATHVRYLLYSVQHQLNGQKVLL